MKKILLYSLISLGLFACSDDDKNSLDLDKDVNINSFTVNGVEGTIDNNNATINVILPLNTPLTSLSPEISIPSGAAVSPQSGVAVNFSTSMNDNSAIEYTVTNGNLYQIYKVVVNEARAKITKFTINGIKGIIDEKARTIKVALPEGTSLEALKPVVEYTAGAKMNPSEGALIDFTEPVTYILNYYGNNFEYTVTVDYGKPDLIIYDGESVSPTWDKITVSSIDSKYSNPIKTGINDSEYCVSITRKKENGGDDGETWSGGVLSNLSIDPTVYNKFSLMILKETAGDVQIEIQENGEKNKDYMKVYYTTPGEWQELTFNIPTDRTAIINKVLVAPHVQDTAEDNNFHTQRVYWDNLKAIMK